MASPLPTSAETLLHAGYAEGRATYGEVILDIAQYTQDVAKLVYDAREAIGLETTSLQLVAALGKRALADLVLARACDAGCEAAWRKLVELFQPRLMAFARGKGARGSAPSELVASVLADLALPPSTGRAKTRIGTYAGMGALGAWLATQVVRRLWKEQRQASRTPEPLYAESRPADPRAPVWTEVVSHEVASRMDEVLERAWNALPVTQRVCMVLKHHHGLTQRRVGDLLQIKEYEVSRHIGRATGSLRTAIERGVEAPESSDGSAWTLLASRISKKLASFEALEALPQEARGTKPRIHD